MAVIENRGGKFRVKVRKHGTTAHKTFTLKRDAERWARETELSIERGTFGAVATGETKRISLGELLTRYLTEISTTKKGYRDEKARINAILRHSITRKKLYDVRSSDWAKYKDERLKKITPQTIHREFNTYKHMYKVAKTEWGFTGLDNPLKDIKTSAKCRVRDRRLSKEEWTAVLENARSRLEPLTWQCLVWARESGMRRGEILKIKWDHVDINERVLTIPETKTDEARQIPITREMLAILELREQSSDLVFPIGYKTLESNYRRVFESVGLLGKFCFHGLRHERISNLFELGLNVPEVASISGHKDWRILARYTHPKPQDILRKLEPIEA